MEGVRDSWAAAEMLQLPGKKGTSSLAFIGFKVLVMITYPWSIINCNPKAPTY